MQRLGFLFGWFLVPALAWAAPDQLMTVTPTPTSGTTITASDETTRNSNISTPYNSHSHTDISQVASPVNIGTGAGGTSLASDGDLVMEGATADAFELTLSTTDPTADRTFDFPNDEIASGDLLVGDGAGSFIYAAPSSDVTMDGAGAFTIADNSVDGTDIAVGSDATGDVLVYDGTNWARVAIGAANSVLRSNGTTASWSTTPTLGTLTLATAAPGTPVADTLYSDSIVKAWGVLDGDAVPATLLADVNVTSITDNGTGDYTFTWDLDFASANYAAVCSAQDVSAGSAEAICQYQTATQAVGSIRVNIFDGAGAAQDAELVNIIAIGDN